MKRHSHHQPVCTMTPADFAGQTNLCCCYALTTDGYYQSPCLEPVEAGCQQSPDSASRLYGHPAAEEKVEVQYGKKP